MSTFKGGQDRQHKKALLMIPSLEPWQLDLLNEAKKLHKEFGDAFLKYWLQRQAIANGLNEKALDGFFDIVKAFK